MTEQKVYGRKACLALLGQRPDDVLRLYHAKAMRDELSGILPWMAARRLAYRELSEDELAKVAGSPHHEGVVINARPLTFLAWPPPAETLDAPDSLWLALDGVTNPHNLGAMLRTSAFFGLNGVLLGGTAAGEKVNAAVLRVAEGGAEWVPLYAVPELGTALTDLHGVGCGVIGLETDGRTTLQEIMRSGLTRRGTVLVMGQEQSGLSRAVRMACDALCALEGRGRLESLNVSVAAGVALALLSTPPPPSPPQPPARSHEAAPPPRAAFPSPGEREAPGRGPAKRSGGNAPGKQRGAKAKGGAGKGKPGKSRSGKRNAGSSRPRPKR